ncbi:MAG TPA: hypothetical protein VHD87_03870 [Acidimicrobiales bacterium]|nr:hypothetical protein [Acidimicrobiales bacterium]
MRPLALAALTAAALMAACGVDLATPKPGTDYTISYRCEASPELNYAPEGPVVPIDDDQISRLTGPPDGLQEIDTYHANLYAVATLVNRSSKTLSLPAPTLRMVARVGFVGATGPILQRHAMTADAAGPETVGPGQTVEYRATFSMQDAFTTGETSDSDVNERLMYALDFDGKRTCSAAGPLDITF